MTGSPNVAKAPGRQRARAKLAPAGSADADLEQFRFAYRLTTPIWLFDIDNARILFANASATELWRALNEPDLQSRDLSVGMSSTVEKRLKQYQADFAEGASFSEVWTVYPKGEPVSVPVNFSGFRLSDGRMAMLCEAGLPDEETPDNIRSTEALLHTDVMISLFRREGPPLYMNPAARNAAVNAEQTFSEIFVSGRDYDTMMFELDRKGEHSLVAKVFTNRGLRWHDLSAKLCADAATGQPAILVTCNDVSDLKNARDKARYLANRDQLTGCFNRAYLQQTVRELAQFQPQCCALLFFDIDRFKQINDRFGHEIGDMVLKKLAARAQSSAAKNDIVVRLGGDEFVVLLRDTPDQQALVQRANDLLEDLRRPLIHNSTRLLPTVSMGLTTFLPGKRSFTSVMREADIALYSSKMGGRDRLTLFNEELGAAAKARDEIELDLKAAIERDEFELHYQPRVDIASQRILSVEALIRWAHPVRGHIPPGEFIPICEETGLIDRVGQIVLERGLSQMRTWAMDGVDIDLSLNISPSQFDDPNLMSILKSYATTPGFPADRVELEVTENVLVGDMEKLSHQLSEISALGYRIAIDDFGVGYSNLSYISKFPVDCIKIDRSFIGDLPAAGPVVRLILALARQIGASTVAEGVETVEQADWLANQDCTQAQGFLFHRPMPLDELSRLLTGP